MAQTKGSQHAGSADPAGGFETPFAYKNREIPASKKVLRVGWVGTGPFSFYSAYILVINNIFREYNPLDMRVTHIWGDDYARNYKGHPEWVRKMLDFWASEEQSPAGVARKCGIPNVCADYREIAGEVDAAMIMDFDRAYELAEPFLRRGLPIFLCSPVAVNVPECKRILDLAQSTGSAVITGSFTFGMPQNRMWQTMVDRANIASFNASTICNFFTSYVNDGLEPIHLLIGPGVRKVQLVGWDGSQGYDPTGLPLSHIHLEYEPRGDNAPIQGSLTLGGYKKEMEWYRVYYRDHRVFEGITSWAGRELNFRDFLLTVQETFALNKSPETREDILTKLKVLIAACKSANEGNRPVRLDEVGDYRLPTVRIEKWDEIPE
ncbi:MAG: Gfo/Idh/MocA family oxidoreductase [Candidatus Latescibacterota bacterium]